MYLFTFSRYDRFDKSISQQNASQHIECYSKFAPEHVEIHNISVQWKFNLSIRTDNTQNHNFMYLFIYGMKPVIYFIKNSEDPNPNQPHQASEGANSYKLFFIKTFGVHTCMSIQENLSQINILIPTPPLYCPENVILLFMCAAYIIVNFIRDIRESKQFEP